MRLSSARLHRGVVQETGFLLELTDFSFSAVDPIVCDSALKAVDHRSVLRGPHLFAGSSSRPSLLECSAPLLTRLDETLATQILQPESHDAATVEVENRFQPT